MYLSHDNWHTLQRLEGFSKTAYRDTGGTWTIGWGHAMNHDPGEVSMEQLETWFREDVEMATNAVTRHVKVELNQNQFDALVIFVFNIGERSFRTSGMLVYLNQWNLHESLLRWIQWNGSGATPCVDGLVIRRMEEILIFLGI